MTQQVWKNLAYFNSESLETSAFTGTNSVVTDVQDDDDTPTTDGSGSTPEIDLNEDFLLRDESNIPITDESGSEISLEEL